MHNLIRRKQSDIGKFVSEEAAKDIREMQIHRTPDCLNQLRNYGVTKEQELKLEFFFFTNTLDKAKKFAREIGKLKYEVTFDKASSVPTLFIITGWTTQMQMSDEVVCDWTARMCDLAYQFDCEFDGWGAFFEATEMPLSNFTITNSFSEN